MVTDHDAIVEGALALPRGSRVALAELLLDSVEERVLSEDEQRSVDEAWLAEIRRRIQDYEQGRIAAVTGEEVMLHLRRKLAGDV